MRAVKRINTPTAIGIEYQNAAELIVTNTIKICSGPYATDDRASDERIANAFVLFSFCSPNSWDFRGLPIKSLFMDENINYSPPKSVKKLFVPLTSAKSQKKRKFYTNKKSAYKSDFNRPVDTSHF